MALGRRAVLVLGVRSLTLTFANGAKHVGVRAGLKAGVELVVVAALWAATRYGRIVSFCGGFKKRLGASGPIL